MKLADYIADMGTEKFADLIGIHRTQVYKYSILMEIPRPSMARKIKELTLGLVDYSDMYDPYFDKKNVDSAQLEFGIEK